MRFEEIRYAIMQAKRNGESVSHIELTAEASEELQENMKVKTTDDGKSVMPVGPIDVKEGSTNQLVTERGSTYSI